MSATETIVRTKIAQILSPSRVVLAAGAEQGVRVGMEFIIYELSDPIFDPETKEPLGQLELHKGRVEVIHVQEKIATAVTPMRTIYRPSIEELFRRGTPRDEHESLRVDKTAVAVKNDLTVRVGDLARSVS